MEPIWFSRPSARAASEGSHGERALRGSAGRAAAGALGEQRCQAHLLEQVESVVAGRAVGAQANVHAGLEQGRHRRDAARELQIGARAMRDVAAGLLQEGDLARIQMHRVHGDQARGRAARGGACAAAGARRTPSTLSRISSWVSCRCTWIGICSSSA